MVAHMCSLLCFKNHAFYPLYENASFSWPKMDQGKEDEEDEEESLDLPSEPDDDSLQTQEDDEPIDRTKKLPSNESHKISLWSITNRFSDAENFLEAITEIAGTANTTKMVKIISFGPILTPHLRLLALTIAEK